MRQLLEPQEDGELNVVCDIYSISVFPQDSSSYHLSLSKKDSGGSRIGRTPSPAGLSSTTALMSAAAASPRDGSTSPSIGGGVDYGGGGGSASNGSSKKGFVAGLGRDSTSAAPLH